MKVSVIIVSYNCKAFLDYCVQSVIKALDNIDGEIIVFDNSSSDGTVEFIESKNYNLRLIKYENNIGFSKANNKAAKFAKGEFLFFLNPDTIIPEDVFYQFFDIHLLQSTKSLPLRNDMINNISTLVEICAQVAETKTLSLDKV